MCFMMRILRKVLFELCADAPSKCMLFVIKAAQAICAFCQTFWVARHLPKEVRGHLSASDPGVRSLSLLKPGWFRF